MRTPIRTLAVGLALGTLLLAAFPALARTDPLAWTDAGVLDEDPACLDEACTLVSLIQTAPEPSAGATADYGYQGVRSPKYGAWGFDLAGRDMTVRPGDDFMRYANGTALRALVIPPDRTAYGSFALLRELSDNRMMAVVTGLVARTDLAPGSDEAKIADAYRSYMDTARIERLDARPLRPYLRAIRAADTHARMAAYMGRTQGRLGASFFGTVITADARAPDRYVVSTGQGGLGLPNRDYYLSPRFADKKAIYQAYVAQVLTLIGWHDPVGNAAAVVALETAVAERHWTPIENRDRDRTYNPTTVDRLMIEAPGFDWRAYFDAGGLGGIPRLIARQDTALPPMAELFAATPVPLLQAWEAFHTADEAAPVLSRRFSDAQWGFRQRDLSGQPEQRSRDKRAVSFAEGALGEAAGRLYVADYFPADSRARMQQLVANLRTALSHRIDGLSWMGPQTRAAAQEKLRKFTVKIGYPDHWRDYSGLRIRADDAFGNAQRRNLFEWNRDLSRLNGPVDQSEWSMTPQTVNAYYNAPNNEIVFPAAILQPPFFDPEADPAVNYGGIGAIIGHEIGHGFDDQGSKSDGDGVLRDWWAPADRAAFEALTARLGVQYDAYEPLPGLHVQGRLTMGENIGDASGVAVGLEAYHIALNGRPAPVLDGTTGDQRFFLGWAQVWQSRMRDEAARQQIATDVHSPAAFRVIGPLRNMDAWYAAFDVGPDSAYYLAPTDRVRIW